MERDIERRVDGLAERVDDLERALRANCATCRDWPDPIEADAEQVCGFEAWERTGGRCPACGREPRVVSLTFAKGANE